MTHLFESVLVGAGDVSAIPLREHEQALMPKHGKVARLRRERHEVVHKSVDHLVHF